MSKETDSAKIKQVAGWLDVDPSWLDALINFETAGSYDPLKAGSSVTGAHGLIQVINSTAQSDFGYPDSLSLVKDYPTFDDQMDNVVYPYLAKYVPYTDQQSLYMAVFYPAYRFVDPKMLFPANVRQVNPGISCPQDYINFVNARIKTSAMHFPLSASVLPILVAGGLAAWYLLKRG